MDIDLLPPIMLDVRQAGAVVDVVAQDHQVRLQQGVVLGRGGVVELEPVRPVVHADVVGEGLVHVVEEGDRCGGRGGDVGLAVGEAAGRVRMRLVDGWSAFCASCLVCCFLGRGEVED